MTKLPPPNWLRTFEAAARFGGFSSAGKALGLTPVAVSQQIKSLETHLGFRLFDRQARGVVLNEMGRAYLPSVRRAFEDLESATEGLFWSDERAHVTVRAPVSYTALRLAPRLRDFQDRYSHVSVRLCTELWAGSVEGQSVDLDICYGNGHWDGAQAVRLTEPRSVLVCPPETECGPDHASFLADAATRAIHVSGYESLWARLGRRFGLNALRASGAMAADSSLVALEMVAAGAGSAVIAQDLAAQHIQEGRVSAPDGFALEHEFAHYLVRPVAARVPNPGALLLRNWLLEQSETNAPLGS